MRKTLNILTIISIALVFVLGYVGLARADTTIRAGFTNYAGAGPTSEGATLGINYTEDELSAGGSFLWSEEANDDVTSEIYRLWLGYDPKLTEDGVVSLWSLADFKRSHSELIRGSLKAGGGVKCTFLDNDTAKASYSIGLMGDYTDFVGVHGKILARLSHRLKVQVSATDNITLAWAGYHQPNVEDLRADYILDSELEANYRFNDTWSAGFKRTDSYRSKTPNEQNHEVSHVVSVAYDF